MHKCYITPKGTEPIFIRTTLIVILHRFESLPNACPTNRHCYGALGPSGLGAIRRSSCPFLRGLNAARAKFLGSNPREPDISRARDFLEVLGPLPLRLGVVADRIATPAPAWRSGDRKCCRTFLYRQDRGAIEKSRSVSICGNVRAMGFPLS